MASASGTGAPAIARLVAADSNTVRDVIHAFNAQGLAMLAPHWGTGRSRRTTDEDIAVVGGYGHDPAGQAGVTVHALQHP